MKRISEQAPTSAAVNGATMDLATFIVTGISEDGHRSIIAVDYAFNEAEIHWRRIFRKA